MEEDEDGDSYGEDADAEHFEGEGDVVEDAGAALAGELDGVGDEELGVGAAAGDRHAQRVEHLGGEAGAQRALLLMVHDLLPVAALDEEVDLAESLHVRQEPVVGDLQRREGGEARRKSQRELSRSSSSSSRWIHGFTEECY